VADVATLPRKERERLSKRQEILEAARKVFAEKGYEKATLDEIAERAEFSKAALYYYFDSKESLFLALFQEGIQEMDRLAETAVQGKRDCRAKVASYIEASLDYVERHSEFFRIFLTEQGRLGGTVEERRKEVMLAKHLEQTEFIARILRQGIREGTLKRLDPEKLAVILQGLVHSCIFQGLVCGPTHSIKEYAQLVTTVFFDGVARH